MTAAAALRQISRKYLKIQEKERGLKMEMENITLAARVKKPDFFDWWSRLAFV